MWRHYCAYLDNDNVRVRVIPVPKEDYAENGSWDKQMYLLQNFRFFYHFADKKIIKKKYFLYFKNKEGTKYFLLSFGTMFLE